MAVRSYELCGLEKQALPILVHSFYGLSFTCASNVPPSCPASIVNVEGSAFAAFHTTIERELCRKRWSASCQHGCQHQQAQLQQGTRAGQVVKPKHDARTVRKHGAAHVKPVHGAAGDRKSKSVCCPSCSSASSTHSHTVRRDTASCITSSPRSTFHPVPAASPADRVLPSARKIRPHSTYTQASNASGITTNRCPRTAADLVVAFPVAVLGISTPVDEPQENFCAVYQLAA